MENLLKQAGLDRYDRNARVKPALLALLPALVVIAVWYPATWTALTGLVALISVCGAIFLLSRLARYLGRKVQDALIRKAGALETTVILRHADATISAETKRRYHDFLRKSGLRMPTVEEEQRNPQAADDCYRAAADWLREKTRDEKKFSLLKGELTDFGFRRNLLGLKPIGVAITILALIANSLQLWRHTSNETLLATAIVLEFFLLAALSLWLALVRMPFVEDAGRSYAVRLLSECDTLPKKQTAAAA